MTSTAVRNHLLNVIRIIETCRESQETIDKTYNELYRVIIKEMEYNIPNTIGQRDHVKNFEYTNHTGTMNLRDKEEIYMKYKNRTILY